MLFNWDVSRIQRSFWGQVFEAFATGICVLTVQNMATAELDIGRILSVCVSVRFVQLFAGRFLDQFEQDLNCNFMKRALKNRVLATVVPSNSLIFVPHPACLGRYTLLKWRLRRNYPLEIDNGQPQLEHYFGQ